MTCTGESPASGSHDVGRSRIRSALPPSGDALPWVGGEKSSTLKRGYALCSSLYVGSIVTSKKESCDTKSHIVLGLRKGGTSPVRAMATVGKVRKREERGWKKDEASNLFTYIHPKWHHVMMPHHILKVWSQIVQLNKGRSRIHISDGTWIRLKIACE